MAIFREIPPTAGFPIALREVLALCDPRSYRGSLEADFEHYLKANHAKVTYSGTAALYFILESLKRLSSKKTVIIPSYVCPLVPLAIQRAGLKVAVCDINQYDFNFNPTALDNLCAQSNDILAIIAVHLAGIAVNLEIIENIAHTYKLFVVEDCAQSLGASFRGKKIGSFSDFSFFSLCRGKGLTTYEGGVVVANNNIYADNIEHTCRSLVKNDFLSESLKISELLGYAMFYRPFLFWFVFRLPELFWNLRGNRLRGLREEYEVNFPTHRVSGFRKRIAHICFERLETEIEAQRLKAQCYFNELVGVNGIRIIQESAGDRATYPFLVLLFDDPELRNRAYTALENRGLGVSQLYAFSIGDYDYLKDFIPSGDSPNGRFIAEGHLTLSTSTFLKTSDITAVTAFLKHL
ncbi:MAG: DegT/DnrJ/EryC1/StrS family aminotransferase [Candidatus Omnitrophota bacterium]